MARKKKFIARLALAYNNKNKVNAQFSLLLY